MGESAKSSSHEIATPAADAMAMPARFSPHARTLITWPPTGEAALDQFRTEVETVAHAIARFEPVTVVVDPSDSEEAHSHCGDIAEILETPVDACWIRDNGPIFVKDPQGQVAGVHFGFNGWGGKWSRETVHGMPRRVMEHLRMYRYVTPFICEGGGISVDGEGTLITTEQVMLNPNRYRDMTRRDIERALHDWLGIEKVIWLGRGLVEDVGTDGHVDNVVEYVAPGVVLAQTVADTKNLNHELLKDNLERLRSATDAKGRRLEIIEMDVLPYTAAPEGTRYVVPYTNAYVVNGAVIVPEVDPIADERGFRILEQAYPGREIVPVPSIAQAMGGGGLGCITQQVPAGAPKAP